MKNDFFVLINKFFKKLYSLTQEENSLNYNEDEQKDEGDFKSGR